MVAVVDLSISDPGELASLRKIVERIPGLRVRQMTGRTAPGEQGAFDFLQIAATAGGGGGALLLMIRTLPDFIRSRRRDVSIVYKAGDMEVTITAATAADAVTLIEKSIDAGRA
ncbi:effector-associated constant component EACC1 [Nocardia sp. FBN12]|uniref:effector-associated constant component EACC1 n=1 Tax=Nocardia sp. FBN12 TaxID=3419766 RepID=UPI003CFF4DDA